MSDDIEGVSTDALAAMKAEIIRESATAFVELMAQTLVDQEHVPDINAAYREVAIQATFNATVLFEALPEPLQQTFASTLRSANGG